MSNNDPSQQESLLTELVVSRLVHEIVGPIGAVANGMELLQEFDDGPDPEVMKLIADSTQEASARMQFYRVAYGRAGYQINDLAQLRGIASEFFSGLANYELVWPLPPLQPQLCDGFGRIVLILTELAKDCLPRGGTIDVVLSNNAASVTATAGEVALPETLAVLLDGGVASSPREVHAALAVNYANAADMVVSREVQASQIRFTVKLQTIS